MRIVTYNDACYIIDCLVHLGQNQDGNLSACLFVMPTQIQWHHWSQLLQHTIASLFPLLWQISDGHISCGLTFDFFIFFDVVTKEKKKQANCR